LNLGLSVKACLFDLDGVLVDTANYHYLAWSRLARELGFAFSRQDNERLKGVSRMASLEILLEIGGVRATPEEKVKLAEQKNQEYVRMISVMDSSEVLPGALPFLRACRENGYKTALGSASRNAMTIMVKTGLLTYFDAIIDGTKTANAKPDPEVFRLGAEALGVSPGECVVFEDAQAGIEAAVRAGMRCVGIGSSDYLAKADLVIPSLQEMSVSRLLALQTHPDGCA
jgi:beta-phosphoglucomutase